MGSHYKEEKKKIKERYDDDQLHNGIEGDHHADQGVDQDHELLDERKSVDNNRKFLHFERENELDEKHKSLRLQSYQKPKDKCASFKSALKRFVIILLIISVICGSVYLISDLLAKRRLKTFSLQGNETHFAVFEGLDSLKEEELGEIYLQNVQLVPQDFLAAIKACTSLKSIKLQNIRLINNGEFNDTVYLPALKNFFYDETSSDYNSKATNIVGSKITMPEQKLKSILFFRKDQRGEGGDGRKSRNVVENVESSGVDDVDLSLIWTLKVNINITFDGTTVLVVNHTQGELVLPWLNYLKREEIIQHSGKDLRKLHCNRLKLSIDSIPPRITHLTLRDVKLVDGDFTTLLTKLDKLVDIRVGFPELVTLDLADLPRKTLKNLALSKFSLVNSKSGGDGGGPLKLKSLSLISPNLTMDVVQEFTTIFQIDDGDLAVSEYYIGGGGSHDDGGSSPEQLNNNNNSQNNNSSSNNDDDDDIILLKQLVQTPAERIFMYKYRGSAGSLEPQQWPMITGISKDASNFVLESTKGKTTESQWNFRYLDWNQWHHFKHHAMGLDKFWAHAGNI